MEFKLVTGMTAECTAVVTEKNTAAAVGSGSLEVYATPAMAALMEQAAAELVDRALDNEWTSVGTSLQIEHTAPTPLGMQVTARVRLMAVEGRRLSFSVEAFDEQEQIGHGQHQRVIVRRASFMQKAAGKMS